MYEQRNGSLVRESMESSCGETSQMEERFDVQYQDEDRDFDRISKEVVKEAIKLAESWEYDLQLSGKK